ncbi:1-acyl-sn-glycerol-3-phosphate acyltransferase [Mycobacterium branderi]|uniref:1-acyl-sn-glycerol-3-phosphate acyltransferase n=2 Tax=Mycobacterium branderi TaxID=43348 RepID=A0AA91RFZ7_9MYCO|nr:1-acyl-sn-glycerol-3-phosphate acyltransferase [Mycobacterium branderi]ORA32608.1 1-acyl-sn-glycerol-3-phosphate acyltransferase [Mycobacterium branderi]
MIIGCLLRHCLWRVICTLSGGLRISGRPPAPGGCVLIANHSSHADTAVLLAALPPSTRPVFAAAADYWFDVPIRRALATTLAGTLPVHRSTGGAYAALLAAAKPALAAGRAVVIYPEGTRSRDGSIGDFRTGALRLARDCNVPLIPVGLRGTAAVLPKNGHFRRGAMLAHFGDPIDPRSIDACALRQRVIALRDK